MDNLEKYYNQIPGNGKDTVPFSELSNEQKEALKSTLSFAVFNLVESVENFKALLKRQMARVMRRK